MSKRALDHASRPGAWWVLPAAVYFAVFALVPLGLVVYLSFTSWDGLGSPKLIGTGNWTRMFSDGDVRSSLRISLVLTALCWVTQTPVALLMGVWAAGRQRNRAVLSAIFFLPLILSSAAVAVVWGALLDSNFGVPAWLAPKIGLGNGNFLGSTQGALWCLVFVIAWQFVPFHTLLYQAGTRQIPGFLYDAAIIDGAGRVQQFWSVTLPQLRNTVVTSSVLMIVGSLTYFDTVLILTNGGPGTATDILPLHMYTQGFKSYEMGYASTIATGLVILGTAVSLLIVRFSGFAKMRSTLEGV